MIQTVSGHGRKETPPLDWFSVRAFFVSRGDSAAAWARRNGYARVYVYLASRGLRRGPKARRIVAELKRDLDL